MCEWETKVKCVSCNAKNKENAKFCCGCGAAIPVANSSPSMAEPQVKSCPDCQASNKVNAKFCQKCGCNFSRAATAAAHPPAEQPSAATASRAAEADATADKSDEGKPCPSCDSQLKPNAKFCGKCGFSFSAKPQAAESVMPINLESIQLSDDIAAKNIATAPTPIAHEAARTSPVQHNAAPESSALPHKKSHAPLIGALALLLCATAAGGYWWFWGNSPAEVQVVASSETDALASAASSTPATTAIDPVSVVPDVATAAQSQEAGNDPAPVAEAPKSEQKLTIAKPAISDKPKHTSVATVQRPSPVPEYTSAPAPDVKLDPQSESLLAMGEQMYASKTNSGALGAAKQVLRKYPGNPRATRLKNKAQAEIERQMAEARQRGGW